MAKEFSQTPMILALWHLELSPQTSAPPLLSRAAELVSPLNYYPFATLTLFSFLSFSQLGRWIYDLTTQQLTQTRVPSPQRSSFGGTEMSIVSLVSLVHWIAAAVWHAQSNFKWLALGSFIGVGASVGIYVA
jgi:iron-regulated transporter 1